MPSFYPGPALTTIAAAAQYQLSYKPLLLIDIVLVNGITALHLATDNITYTTLNAVVNVTGDTVTYVSGSPLNIVGAGATVLINSVGYTVASVSTGTIILTSSPGSLTNATITASIAYQPLLTKNTLDRVQQLTAIGIDSPPGCTIEIADPAGAIFSAYELNASLTPLSVGFKGATVTATFILIDKITGAVSTDARVKFIGRADPPNLNDKVMSFKVRSKLDLSGTLVPNVPVSKLCPWPFPGTAAQQATISDRYSIFYMCGYDGTALDPDTGLPFTTCNYDQPSCSARGMLVLGRYGGIDFEPPASWANPHIYTSGTKGLGWDTDNQAKYQSYVPLNYGPGLIKGIVTNVLGNGNDVRFEVIVGFGDMEANGADGLTPQGHGGIDMVIVNNVVVPHVYSDPFFNDPGGKPTGFDPNFCWQYVNNGQRNGTPNTIPLYDSKGDPYGSMMTIVCVVPTTVHGNSNSVPDVLIISTTGKKVRTYNAPGSIATPDPDYPNSRPIWTIMDLLVSAGAFSYADFDIQSAIDAQTTVCSTLIPFTGVAGPWVPSGVAVSGGGINVNIPATGTSGTFKTVVNSTYTQWSSVYAGQVLQITDSSGNDYFVRIASITDAYNVVLESPGTGTNFSGGSLLISHERYRLNLVLQQRQDLASLINPIKLGCNLNLVVNSGNNQLQFFIDQGLGDQQPAPIAGSNDTSTYLSYLATAVNCGDGTGGAVSYGFDGRMGVGYVAYNFNDDNILLTGNEPNFTSSLIITQAQPNQTPNRIITQFQNEEIKSESDTSTRVDTDDYGRMQRSYDATVRMEGVPNFDQLFRRANNYMARNFRGNPRSSPTYGDTGGTLTVELKTPGMQVTHLRVGHLVALSSTRLGIGGFMGHSGAPPSGQGQIFRIQGIALDDNSNIATLTMAWHDDRWFLDSYGNGPSPKFAASAQSLMIGPPYGWIAYGGAQPLATDPIYTSPQYWQPSVQVLYQSLADNSILALLRTIGRFPVNNPTSNCATPNISLQGTVDVSAGTVPAGHYYAAVIAVDSAGGVTFPQLPQQLCQIDLASVGSLIIPQIVWSPGTAQGAFFVGSSAHHMQFQGYIPPVSGNMPVALTISNLTGASDPAVDSFPMPDPRFDHVQMQAKRVRHAGPVGAEITSVTTGHVVIANAGFTAHQWMSYNMAVIGVPNSQSPIPVFNSFIIDNTATDLHLVIDPMSHGIIPGSVLIIYSSPTISADADGNTVFTDANWVNSLGPVGNQNTVSSIALLPVLLGPTNVGTITNPGFLIGDTILFRFDDGTTFTDTVISVPSFSGTNWFFECTRDVALNAKFLSDPNCVVYINTGLAVDAEAGNLLRIVNEDGTSTTWKIKSNTGTSITTDGPVIPTPTGAVIYLVEEPDWHNLGVSTQSVSYGDPLVETDIDVEISNYEDETILVQTLLVSKDGQTSALNDSPFRMMWIYGQQSLNSLTTYIIERH